MCPTIKDWLTIIGKNIKSVWLDTLRPKYRNFVAHYMIDNEILYVSNYSANTGFNNILVLVEICVRKVIDNQISYYEQLEKFNKEKKKS